MASSSWKRLPEVDVPELGKDSIKIVDISTKVPGPDGQISVHYLDGLPGKGVSQKLSLLLLHGMRYTAETWRELGTIELFCSLGYRVVAVDLPGYGKTPGEHLKGKSAGEFLGDVIRSTRLVNPVIVSPSMSGVYSLAYLFLGAEGVKGYVPVTPVGTEHYPAARYAECPVPTCIIYGANDNILGEVSRRNLSAFASQESVCFQEAGHACYLDKPDLWHRVLYNFLINIDG